MADSEGRCCCGCCSVRTGTIIISTFWLILAIYNVFACTSQLAILMDSENYEVDELVQMHVGEYRETLKEFYINYRTLATILTVLVLIGELVNVPLSAFCLHGAVKRGPAVRLALWIYYNAFCAVLSALFSIVMGVYITNKLGGTYGFGMVLGFVLAYTCYYYVIRVVYYYMEEIRRTETGLGGRGLDGCGRGGVAVVREPVTFDGVGIGIGFVPTTAGEYEDDPRGPPPPYQEKAYHPI